MNTQTTEKKMRQSNIELLRIISMLMIVLFHANYFSLDIPGPGDGDLFPRAFFECLCTGAVNTFVLISGWFGIRPSLKGILNLLFQCVFIITAIYMICIFLGRASLSSEGIRSCFMMTMDYWFIKAYIALYLVAPALNLFVENTSAQKVLLFLCFFYAYQTLYGWIIISTEWMAGGYSFFSFIGLYVLSRICSIHQEELRRYSRHLYFFIFWICIFIMSLLEIVGIHTTHILSQAMLAYSNPMVIISSMSLVIYFSYFDFQSKVVNWIAKSCLAVYLCHLHPMFVNDFIAQVNSIYRGAEIQLLGGLYILVFCVVVFIASIIFDKIRLLIWSPIQKRIL